VFDNETVLVTKTHAISRMNVFLRSSVPSVPSKPSAPSSPVPKIPPAPAPFSVAARTAPPETSRVEPSGFVAPPAPALPVPDVMAEMEKPFMVKMDRDEAESALRPKAPGAFLLRPKDPNALVASVRLGDEVVHLVLHRVGQCYQCEAVSGGAPFRALPAFMDGLRTAHKLQNITFFERAADAPTSESEARVSVSLFVQRGAPHSFILPVFVALVFVADAWYLRRAR